MWLWIVCLTLAVVLPAVSILRDRGKDAFTPRAMSPLDAARIAGYRAKTPEAVAYSMGFQSGQTLGSYKQGDATEDDYPGNPLSGEWAGDMTPDSLCTSIGVDVRDAGARDDVCEVYEYGHLDGWMGTL